jgi:hypothetical protein
MRTSRSSVILPVPVRRALRKLGHDLRNARRRRRIPPAIAAERASIGRTTLIKNRKGAIQEWRSLSTLWSSS